MGDINNLKEIRELYGATQEQVAQAINVNRVTVINWESGASTASNSNQEKLSLYYGIGPEYFYQKELDELAKEVIRRAGTKEKELDTTSTVKKNRSEALHQLLGSMTFNDALSFYTVSMKMLLATADDGDLDKLETAYLINQKMGTRLKSVIDLRKQEAEGKDPSLSELLKQLRDEQ